jgi:hypothetical protein
MSRKWVARWLIFSTACVVLLLFVVLYAQVTVLPTPKLRQGMTLNEVNEVMGMHATPSRSVQWCCSYRQGPTWSGDRRSVVVYFDDDLRVTRWDIHPKDTYPAAGGPPWYDRFLKAIGF